MHTTELDNDVNINYDGGDLGGLVRIRFPGSRGKPIETTWDEIKSLPDLLVSLKKLKAENEKLEAERYELEVANDRLDMDQSVLFNQITDLEKERDELRAFIFDLYENRLELDKLLCLIVRKRHDLRMKGGK